MGEDDRSSRERIVDPARLERMSDARSPWTEAGDLHRDPGRDRVLDTVREIVQTRLTPRQREIVQLYYYEGRTQQEIAEQLGISQQVVSRQLFGVMRHGKKIGGAIRRLRALLEAEGLGFPTETETETKESDD